jgi:two-component system, sensor histidine kinase RegB
MIDAFRRTDDPLGARLGTVVLIRWLAIAGQSLTVLVVELFIGHLALIPVVATIGASVLLNALLSFGQTSFRRLDRHQAAWHMAFDVVQLAVLIDLTGGLQNPFCIFIMAPVALAAATLEGRQATFIAGLAVVGMSVVPLVHSPLPWSASLEFPPLYKFGSWAALCVGIASIAFFTWQMANEKRRMDAAYEASRTALLQEQRVAAVGGLAAMVAHELNTPLATVCLVAREVAGQMCDADPHFADIKLLVGQAERCRDILARLSRRRDYDALVKEETVSFSTLVEMAAMPYRRDSIDMVFTTVPSSGASSRREPCTLRSPEILHGLGNLFDNAVQFARQRVAVRTGWTEETAEVRIEDDGPGFPDHLMNDLGEPYLSTRDADGAHLGLGLFIAVTLLSRTGGRVSFANASGGGAAVTVAWRLADLVAPASGEVAHG